MAATEIIYRIFWAYGLDFHPGYEGWRHTVLNALSSDAIFVGDRRATNSLACIWRVVNPQVEHVDKPPLDLARGLRSSAHQKYGAEKRNPRIHNVNASRPSTGDRGIKISIAPTHGDTYLPRPSRLELQSRPKESLTTDDYWFAYPPCD